MLLEMGKIPICIQMLSDENYFKIRRNFLETRPFPNVPRDEKMMAIYVEDKFLKDVWVQSHKETISSE
ncbi:CLUMA_CG013227, isoform A [Clunio marinus]|uniref:CLUMA_CG013227, isoform A n=1 Tax=Clunio marinus TaxID=568069 RepID=A0A1J1II37_9DIPT|nr:CLUMA_CG013227, isoform A [Clunio marinus]